MHTSKIFTLRALIIGLAIIGVLWFSPTRLFSQGSPTNPTQIAQATSPEDVSQQDKMLEEFDAFKRPSLLTQAVVLTLLSLLPFIVMILTSFLKIVIVLSLLRNALGVQQAPPNQIINGIAFMLSLFIMYPTVVKMYEVSREAVYRTEAPESLISPGSSTYILEIASATQEPIRSFLINNSAVKHRALFYRMAYKVLPDEYRPDLKPEDFIIVVPSYITSQLKDAFEIGVLIYIPFFVIDLVTSNILLAMGMMMLSPVTISMPLKLFLLVMLDGWTLLVEGLVNTFR
ncbi:MAG: type III secretion system export apparatus subunit SctR [Waddliaceae bacterium]